MYPRFDTDNAAEISTGFGGLLFMMTAVAYLGAIVVLEAWPVYSVLQSYARGVALSSAQITALSVGLGSALIVTVVAIAWPLREARLRIEQLDR
jgi:ABC-2 type transport system permease protein